MIFNSDVDKWITMWEHDYNEKESLMKTKMGERSTYDLVDKLNPRHSVKGGRTEVFRMHVKVKDHRTQCIRYLDANSLCPYVMANVEFPVGHHII